jgi:hypothetical protein
VSSKSVMTCHLFVATNHLSSLRRHERSMTSLFLSLSSARRMACKRSMEKMLSGNRADVMITYCMSDKLGKVQMNERW